jgi:biopolymer transport protein ExbD
MNFQRGRTREEVEINLIPLIDLLLVILIFLMVTTTYSKFSGMEINLPTAEVPPNIEAPNEINVTIAASGEVLINRQAVAGTDVAAISASLQRLGGSAAASGDAAKAPLVIINADAKTPHQRVIDVMQAAQQASLTHISFATQQSQR